MRQPMLGIAAALGLAVVPARPGAAQVIGLPVYNSGIPSGLGLYGDVAFPNDRAGGGTTLAGTARLGVSRFGVTAAAAYLDAPGSADNVTSVGGTLNYKLLGGPLVPLTVTLQGGLGYAKLAGDVKDYRVPIGLGFALTIPNPVLAIKPWLAPRVDVTRHSRPAPAPSDTETHFGLSGGVELNFLGGFGLHAAYDRVFVEGDDPGIFAAGAHYSLRIPGL